MCPADLPPECLNPLIRAEPVATNNLIIFAPQESRCDFATTTFGNGKNRTKAGHRSPQPCLAAILTPRRLVDINRMDQSREFVVWGFKGNGRLPFQFGDHPSRDRKSEQVAYQLLDMALAEAVGPREHGQHRLKVRTRSNLRGRPEAKQYRLPCRSQGRAGDRVNSRRRSARSWAVQRLDGPRVWGRRRKLMTASAAISRLAVGRLANPLGRDQNTVGLTMSGLPATFLAAGRSRGFALYSDRVRERRFRRVGGVKLEPILEVVDACFQIGETLLVELCDRARIAAWTSGRAVFHTDSGIGGVHTMRVE